MAHTTGSHVTGTAVDVNVRPDWHRTGYRFFPYAAQQSGHWWVLRLNVGFPEHDLYTLFVDGAATADITGGTDNSAPLIASVAALTFADPSPAEPHLDADTAAAVVQAVADYVNYGSEHGDPCPFCSDDDDPLLGATVMAPDLPPGTNCSTSIAPQRTPPTSAPPGNYCR